MGLNKPLSNSFSLHESQDVTIEASTEDVAPKETYLELKEKRRQQVKQSILRTIGGKNTVMSNMESSKKYDPILADPVTKEPLYAIPSNTNSRPSLILADQIGRNEVSVTFQSDGSSSIYKGKTDTYYNLLSPADDNDNDEETEFNKELNLLNSNVNNILLKSIRPLLPKQITQSVLDQDYTPMRDLFTSPFVSFAYERGWRNSFVAAGFPGADEEFELVRDFFRPATSSNPKSVVVDMSCASGLFTRRLAKSKEYNRVIGCDYSDSMLLEARRRIMTESNIGKIELVQCDVAKIPMQDGSIDALNAGAAMHCWPQLQEGLNEIYRVLKPDGGRFFATTFLSKYMQNLQNAEGRVRDTQQQAFQYFDSTDELRTKLISAGFDENNVSIEVLGEACVVMRCEK